MSLLAQEYIQTQFICLPVKIGHWEKRNDSLHGIVSNN